MKQPLSIPLHLPLRWLSGLLLGLLVLCGVFACGGGDVAGVGSGGTGLAQGSVSGFGSVIVDGVEYDDSLATAQQSDATGALSAVSLKLGQRVQVVYSLPTASGASPTVESLRVTPQLIGPVSAALDPDGWLQVMGQWVRVVRRGDDLSRLGPTVLSGFSATASGSGSTPPIVPGDEVLVHGAWTYDSSKSAYVLVATLVDKTSTLADPVQLGGLVQAPVSTATTSTAGSFRLNAPAGMVVQAASLPTDVAAGQVVQVWAARAAVLAAVRAGSASSPLAASRVVVSTLSTADLAGQQQVTLSGLASNYDAASRTVQVQGVRVKIDASAKVDEAALVQGEFVSLQINPSAGGSGLVASSATVRGTSTSSTTADLGATTVIKGVLSGVNWSAAPLSFTLRGTAISATSAVVDASCRSASTSTAVNVQVTGKLLSAGDVVTASQVLCSPAPPTTPGPR